MTQGLKGIGKLYIFDKNKMDIGLFFLKKNNFSSELQVFHI